jgi:hypothetical protein
MFKFLLSQFVKSKGRSPNAIEMLQLKFKASQGTGQVIPFPQKRSFGEEIDSMIKKGEVNVGTADKTPPYKPSKSQTDFEIQERYRADNAKAIKRFEEKMKKDPEDPQKFYQGGQAMIEPNLSDIGHGSDALMARNALLTPGSQATTSTGLNYLLGEDNDTTRVPYKHGDMVLPKPKPEGAMDEYMLKQVLSPAGIRTLDPKTREMFIEMYKKKIREKNSKADGGPARQNFGIGGMSRRAFLKLFGSGVATVGAAKSGLFSLLKGGGSKKAAVDLVTTPNVAGKPVWFDALVNKVIREGDDVSKKFGTKDMEVVHTKKINDLEEVTVTRELDTGDILVEYGPHMTDETGKVIRASNEPGVVSFQYKKGEEIYDTGKGHLSSRKSVKEPDTFNAIESEPRVTDWDGTIEMDGENIVNNVDELLTDTNKLKQYATGKKTTIRELLDGRKKQKYKQTLEENPSEQINYIENKGGGYTSIDDMIDEGARVGDLEPRGYDVKGINLPEKKADGGRIGYGKGDIVTKGIPFVLKEIRALLKNKKKVKQAVDDIYPTGDYKYDAEMAADALVENNPKEFKGLLREDLDDMTRSEVYGAVLGPIQNNALMVSRMKKATKPTKTLEGIEKTGTIDISNPGIADEFTRFMKETNPKGYKDIEEKIILESFDPKGKKGHASGGIAAMLGE